MGSRVFGTLTLRSCKSTLKFCSEIERKAKKMSSDARHLQAVKQIIPELLPSKHKGQAGRIAVVGGSQE